MVLPHPGDAQVFAGESFASKPGFLQKADRRGIGGNAGSLDAMQPQRLEGERQGAGDRRRHVSCARMGRAGPIAEIAGLGTSAPDIGERQTADQNAVELAKYEERISEIAALVFGVALDSATK